MKVFESFPQCAECLLSLIRESPVSDQVRDPRLRAELEASTVRALEDAKRSGLTSPEAANRILKAVTLLTGIRDPYEGFKAEEMARAKEILSRIEEEAGTDLRTRIILAALGNSLDFFQKAEEVLREIPARLRDGIKFHRDDVARFETALEKGPGLALYLTDNAGEVYFDLPLYDHIRSRAERTIVVVKGGPGLNDLTREDLKRAGLTERFDEISDTGTDGVGIDWNHVSGTFRDLVDRSDLIVSKGMANFETLYPRDLSASVFFIFKVKCRPIQDYLGAPPQSFMAFWKGA